MQDIVNSIVRTVTPYIVGSVISWFSTMGVELPQELQVRLSAFATFAFGTLYYVLVRLIGKKYPQIEWLLGAPVKPTYGEK